MQRIGKVVVLPSVNHQVGSEDKEQIDRKCSLLQAMAPLLATPTLSDLPSLPLPDALEERLMDHQKVGVRWLHSLYLSGSGGILGDDMGLGKTFQVICMLIGLMKQQLLQKVLILAPVSVLSNWERELLAYLQPHIPTAKVFLLNSDLAKKKRLQILESTFQQSARGFAPKVVISSYHLVSGMVDDFANNGRWDYVILDEGHVIKNPSTKISKSMHQLSSHHRLILTGTPIQNNLNEFWAIANWATKGKRFGTLSGFKEDFTLPIVAGQDPKATAEQRMIAEEAAKNLLNLTKPILLQRKKCELPSNDLLRLPEKIELVVWSPLATSQRELYEQFVDSRQFSLAINRSTCPVEVINHLKTVCRHPLLIEALEMNRKRRAQQEASQPNPAANHSRRKPKSKGKGSSTAANEEEGCDDGDNEEEDITQAMAGLKVSEEDGDQDEEQALRHLPSNASVFDVVNRKPDVKELLRGSIKLRILLKLVHRLHFAGHRTLIFSQSRLMLDIIQYLLVEYGLASYRIDGSVHGSERQRIIDEFNDVSDDSVGPSICLLTTKACGFGITLTGADRVIIYDPSWNPAEDRQAVDRAYRIGQTKNVVVYRLIMASSVEEKMYEKQVFKDGVRVVTESGTSSRYFSREETTELFTLGPVDKSLVMERLWTAAGSGSLLEFPDTRGALPSVLGFTRHDTLYAEARPDGGSQGQDAYAQFADPNYVASSSDSSEDERHVPSTPAVKKTSHVAPKGPATAQKRLIQQLLPDNFKENVRNGGPPEEADVFDLISPPRNNNNSQHARHIIPSKDVIDLSQSPPVPSPLKSPNQFLDEYNSLRDSKLHRPPSTTTSPVRDDRHMKVKLENGAEDPHSSGHGETEADANGDDDKCDSWNERGDDAWSENEGDEGRDDGDKCMGKVDCSAESESREQLAEDSNTMWDCDEIAAFNALRESKVHRASFSPSRAEHPSAFCSPSAASWAQDENHHHRSSGVSAECYSEQAEEELVDFSSPSLQLQSGEPSPPHSSTYCLNAINLLLGEFEDLPPPDELSGAESVLSDVEDDDVTQQEVPPTHCPFESEYCPESDDVSERESEEKNEEENEEESTVELLPPDPVSLQQTDDQALAVEAALSSKQPAVSNIIHIVLTGGGGGGSVMHSEPEWDALVEVEESEDESDHEEVEAEEAQEEVEEGEQVLENDADVLHQAVPASSPVRGAPADLNQDNAPCNFAIEEEDAVSEYGSAANIQVGCEEAGEEEEEGEEKEVQDDVIEHEVENQEQGQEQQQEEWLSEEEGEASFDSEGKRPGSAEDEGVSYGHFGGFRESTRGRGGYLLNLCEMGSLKRSMSGSAPAGPSEALASYHALVGDKLSSTAVLPVGDTCRSPVCAQGPSLPAPPGQFASPAGAGAGATKWSDDSDRRRTGGITVRKARNAHHFSTYMEPDIFASPPWMASSIFSPPAAVAAVALASDSVSASDLVSMQLSSSFPSPAHLSMECADEELVRNSSKSHTSPVDSGSAASSAGSAAGDAGDAGDLSDLVERVKSLELTSKAAPATPVSKISFQTSTGVFSNMIIKAQSVNRSRSFFADLSDSDSDSDGGEEEAEDEKSHGLSDGEVDAGTPLLIAAGPLTPEIGSGYSPSQFLSSATAASTGSADQVPLHSVADSARDTPSLPAAAAAEGAAVDMEFQPSCSGGALPCATLFSSPSHQPHRSSACWSLASPLSDLSTSRQEEEEGATSARSSPGYTPPPLPGPSPTTAATPSTIIYNDAVDCDEVAFSDADVDASVDASPPHSPLRYDLFRDTTVEALPVAAECIPARTAKLLSELRITSFDYPVHQPHSAMSAEEVTTYNLLLQQAGDSERGGDYCGAADTYKEAASYCDEDPYLHGKLAYLLQVILQM